MILPHIATDTNIQSKDVTTLEWNVSKQLSKQYELILILSLNGKYLIIITILGLSCVLWFLILF